jgi:hypothetical protein
MQTLGCLLHVPEQAYIYIYKLVTGGLQKALGKMKRARGDGESNPGAPECDYSFVCAGGAKPV